MLSMIHLLPDKFAPQPKKKDKKTKRQKDKKTKRQKVKKMKIRNKKYKLFQMSFMKTFGVKCFELPLHSSSWSCFYVLHFGKYNIITQKYSTNHIVNCKWENTVSTIHSKCYTHVRSFFASPLKVFKLCFLEIYIYIEIMPYIFWAFSDLA